MKHLTVRNLPDDLARALESEKRRRDSSLNQTIIELLRTALGVGSGRRPTNGLERLAGSWAEEEFERFQNVTSCFEELDQELWS